MENYLDILFGGGADPMAVNNGIIEIKKAEKHRLSVMAANVKSLKEAARRCPRCCGSGNIAAFQHFKGGSCFACCGTGIA